MTDRFSLRFEKGEREGEIVAITPPRFRLGRRPGNSLQITDPSVSGEHAEFVIDESGALLRDLGSTNGTRVGGEKITEVRLAHGDKILFGSIPVLFEDREFAGTAPGPAAAGSSGGEGIGAVSAEKLARSGKRSRVGLIAIAVLLLVGGGAAAFYFSGGQGGRGRRQIKPVVSVPGNLLSDSSFEAEDRASTSWASDENAPADFARRGEARATGEAGMRAAPDPDQWAILASSTVTVSPGRTFELGASLRARGGARGRVGVELLLPRDGEEDASSLLAWSDWISEVTLHQEVRVSIPIPPGIRQARVLVEGRADVEEGGTVDVDDVHLVAGSGAAQPVAKIGEYGLWLLGDPAQNMVLYKVSTPLVSDVHARGNDPARASALSFSAEAGDFQGGASGATELSLRVEPEALADGLATIGELGLTEHQPDFEREGVTDLLVSSENDLVALRLESPVKVRGRSEGKGARITVPLTGGSFRWQVEFREERTRAGNLAHAAAKAEREGRLGACLALWNELLRDVPFEIELVNEARAARARLEQAGFVELQQVEEKFEVAKFFRLIDLYRRCRSEAQRVGERYGGSEVETQAEALIAEIEVELAGLQEDLNRDEVARLQSILRVLEASESPRLAGEVRGYLKEQYGVGN